MALAIAAETYHPVTQSVDRLSTAGLNLGKTLGHKACRTKVVEMHKRLFDVRWELC
jgi:hypothetical protein